MTLEKYKQKRKFNKTPEPKGKKKKQSGKSIFVVQKHDASHLHYDFRMEIKGVLKSWVVPKGPSINPKDKRLAIETEDHPYDYANFEGKIPEGQYGTGTVIIWDKGTYENTTENKGKKLPVEKAYEHGHISFQLEGEKLKGGFALSRFREDKWLLVKQKDKEADARVNILKKDKSVKSGKTLKEVEK